ncbi:hypothetical protein BJ875DRAFT_47893 [Amylocarpus encephaloides]|uniref:Uncharacterized protein n=1 Tax=Amylocarpus encephaloides TaxID=45428 RepID=A0A9P8C9F9_9HELO|nr:hypothetical protein BJ875DRAFT_47893 [Amylocarpus encephaloides]
MEDFLPQTASSFLQLTQQVMQRHSHNSMAMSSNSLDILPICVVVAFGTRYELLLTALLALSFSPTPVEQLIGTYAPLIPITYIPKGIVPAIGLLQAARYIITLSTSTTSSGDFPTSPTFFPCKISHRRYFPKKHNFVYSYLLCGIPVGWKGTAGGMLSVDVAPSQTPWYLRWLSLTPSNSWFSVHGDHYLGRGRLEGGLESKLRAFLKEESLDPDHYAHAYLMTAAKFCGYSSNPVSFYYLYSKTKALKAIIAEVNNTFDESRMYFLEPEKGQDMEAGKDAAAGSRFTYKWNKDLFVSPFNDRSGGYSLVAGDMLAPNMSGQGPVNMNLTLTSSEGKPKLTARMWSVGPAIDPATMSLWQKTGFLFSWWWVGLVTMPRTIVQAVVLIRRHNLPFSGPPEPKKETVPRHAAAYEAVLEDLFYGYLRLLVSQVTTPIRVSYTPAGITNGKETMLYSPSALEIPWGKPGEKEDVKELSIKIISPTFYSRLLHYGFCSLPHILLSESGSLNQTLSLSDSALVSSLFASSCPPRGTALEATSGLPWYERLAVSLLDLLTDMETPAAVLPTCDGDPEQQMAAAKKIQKCHHNESASKGGSTPSLLAHMAAAHPAPRRCFLFHGFKLHVAPHIAFNDPRLVDWEICLVRCVGVWFAVKLMF